jgi:hypothetical protein
MMGLSGIAGRAFCLSYRPTAKNQPRRGLGIDRTCFTVNDRPTFLSGVGYYGALGASAETVRRDLADLERLGFNWVRAWATWAAFGKDVSAVAAVEEELLD